MRFVVCGEALVDLVPAGEANPQASNWRALSGGSALNSAIALARLGNEVEFLGRLGNDAFAAQISDLLDANAVGTSLCRRTNEATSVAVVSLAPNGSASYTFHFTGTANFNWYDEEFPQLAETDWLHFGSVAAIVSPGAEAIARFVARNAHPMSIDLNVRPVYLPDPAEYWRRLEPLLASVGAARGVIKGSDEDVEFLAQGDSQLSGQDLSPTEIAIAWASRYETLVALTLGPDGAIAVTPDGHITSYRGVEVEVADTIGAGDTFVAGFISKYVIDPHDLAAALRQGVLASAQVCSRVGANPPTTAELAAFAAKVQTISN